MEEDKIKKMRLCAIWLIKNLCIDTAAEKAIITQDILWKGKKLGDYKITIERIVTPTQKHN